MFHKTFFIKLGNLFNDISFPEETIIVSIINDLVNFLTTYLKAVYTNQLNNNNTSVSSFLKVNGNAMVVLFLFCVKFSN